MPKRLYLDLHILQSVPPSNINRDDAGTPKHAMFGGTRRARVSSQAWKRATRLAWAKDQPETDRATRTKRIAALLSETLQKTENLSEEDANRLATGLLSDLGVTPSQRKTEETSYLLFFGRPQLRNIAGLVHGMTDELLQLNDKQLQQRAKELKVADQLRHSHPAEVALFGRMIADRADLNVDATVQVAHALSTHAVETEFDYYTAVDDENPADESGAGMIGTVEYNSATYYRYATVNVPALHTNLGGTDGTRDETADAVARFVHAFSTSMPKGHQNSFAHRTLPQVVVASLRTDQPINLVSAYEKPVRAASGGIADRSAQRLAEEARVVEANWGGPAKCFGSYTCREDEVSATLQDAFGRSRPFGAMAKEVRESTLAWLGDGVL